MMHTIVLALLFGPAARADDFLQYYQQLPRERIKRTLETSRHQNRPPARPIHKSILEHNHKIRILNAPAVHSDADPQRHLNAAKVNASDTPSSVHPNDEETNTLNSNVNDANQNGQQTISPLLTSPWWNRIHEDYGTHSYNFIPESRRAASSVVYLLPKDRRLEGVIDDSDENINGADETLVNENANKADAAIKKGTTSEIKSSASNSTLLKTNGTVVSKNNTSSSEAAGVQSDESSKIQSKPKNTNATTTTENKSVVATNQTNTSQSIQNKTTNIQGEEYMIISGGYTDHDWKSFPVYAFPLSSSITSGSGKWIDLSPLPSELQNENSDSWCKSQDNLVARDRLHQEAKYLNVNATQNEMNPWEHADPCAPSGRMGHSSFVHENYLYVFGGLIYDAEQAPTGSGSRETFRLEDVPYVYRLDLAEMFDAREVDSRRLQSNDGKRKLDDTGIIDEIESLLTEEDDATIVGTIENMEEVLESVHDVPPSNKKVKGWQRIIPRVKPFESLDGMPAMAASEVLLKSINRGEMQGGMWNGKYVMYGGLRIVLSDVAGPHTSSKIVKGPAKSSGGSTQRSRIIELPLGDVWAFDIESNAFEKVTNSFGKSEGVESKQEENEKEFEKEESTNDDDDSWWSRLDASMYPRPRTAHAATVVGDELVIHGGMGWDEHVDDWDGSTNWETLDDMWILNLKSLQWKRRWMFPLLVRSYHSLVGWSVEDSMMGWGKEFANLTSWEGPVVAAFGGFTNGIDVFSGEVTMLISAEEVDYVFDDVLVSYPPLIGDENFGVSSLWLKARNPDSYKYPEQISNRFEHSAVMSREGSMFVWGGQFQDTSMVKGFWTMNIAGPESQIRFTLAESDGIFDDYEATLTALHTIVLMMMFLSMTLTLLLGLTQRYNELIMQQTNGDTALRAFEDLANQDVASTIPRGRGLHPQIINTLPEKIYRTNTESGAEESESKEETNEEECCPICLVEYEDGESLRVLPCNHYMHKSCVDEWLVNHPSCPSCRHSLSELVDDRPLMQLRTLRSRLAGRSSTMRRFRHYHSAWSEQEIPQVEMGPEFDLHFISTLELIEEGGADNMSQQATNEQGLELADMNRRSRTNRLARVRRNLARMRRERAGRNGNRAVPLDESLDEDPDNTIT
ncbi:hypothetical protein ACHAWO_004463 [Cyclotella atomus]|uniref:RING-type domain-containing protein n=1 Tax=Cyclotella atomus TaxID=382360 RepID=A0ABD3NZK7_9STRA